MNAWHKREQQSGSDGHMQDDHTPSARPELLHSSQHSIQSSQLTLKVVSVPVRRPYLGQAQSYAWCHTTVNHVIAVNDIYC